ncbi:hypothetical protein EV401DRAFT_433183 [Pisolithus croceorrhizus]|nr:hypothetical protein EV401DRAFT_433183 [Pisolithus croceorrhizus]
MSHAMLCQLTLLTTYVGTDIIDYGSQCCAFFVTILTMVRECLVNTKSLEAAPKLWNASTCNLLCKGLKWFLRHSRLGTRRATKCGFWMNA